MIFSTQENWTERETALEPLAVVARDSSALALALRLLDRSDAELGHLRGAVSGATSEDVLVVAGPFELLPWAPEAIYLGGGASASGLLWPVHLTPPFAPDLMERALRHRFPTLAMPMVLVPQWRMVLPLGEALPVRRSFTADFLAKVKGGAA